MEQPNTRGRPKGSPDKITRLSKDNISQAFEMLGGVEGMVEWANASNANLTEFYRIYSKLVPRQLDVKNDGNPLSLTVVRYESLPPPMKTVKATVIHDDRQLIEQARNDLGISVTSEICESIDVPNENHSQ